MKYRVEFTHTIEQTFIVTVDAESEEEARKMIDDDAYAYVKEGQEPEREEGIKYEINEITESED